MKIIEQFKQYPLVLWALALYLCSLGFNLKYDIPLAIFAMTSVYAISNLDHHITFKQAVKQHWAVILFLIITVIVTLASRDVQASIRAQYQLLPALLMYLTLVLYVETAHQRRFVVVVLVAAALVAEVSFMAQVLYLTEILDRLEKMWAIESPLFVAPNDVLFFAVLAPLAAFLLVSDMSRLVRALGMIYLLLTFIVTLYMQSRQAVGVLLGGLFLMAILRRPALGAVIVIGGGVLVLAVDWVTGKGLLNKLVYLFPRRYVWEAAWQMFLDRPWLGHGPGMYKEFYVEYVGKAGYVFEELEDRRPMNWAHSLYMEQMAERGLLGFLALILMMLAAMSGLMSQIKQLGSYSLAILACWASYLVAGIAETSLLRLWAVCALFILLGLTNTKRDKNEN